MPRMKKMADGGNKGIAALIASLQSSINPDEVVVSTASQLYKELKWIPFIDPKTGVPCITLSWLIGCKGFPTGRITQLRASYSAGKSSFLYYLYACALRGQTDEDVKAWVGHIETEGAPNPPDYIKCFGLNPDSFVYMSANSLATVFSLLDTFVCNVRGGFGGSIGDSGRVRKTTFTNAWDAANKYPIILGVDSFSALGDKKEASQDVLDISNAGAMAYVSRELRRYLRDRQQRFARTDTSLFVTSLETAKVASGPMAYGGPQKSALGQEALAGAMSFGLEVSDRKWNENGVEVGSIQGLKTFKNKFAPRWRSIDLYREGLGGYSIVDTDVNFLLTHPESPFMPGKALNKEGNVPAPSRSGGYIRCPLLNNQKSYRSKEEFMHDLHENQDLLMAIMEGLRVRGYGFDFETNYSFQETDEPDPAEHEPVQPPAGD